MIWRWLVNSLAVAAATFLVGGITVHAADITGTVVTLVLVALILGAVNTLVKPLFELLTGCLVILTFGLFLLVINALMLLLTSWLAGMLGIGWNVADFPAAFWGSVVISVISLVLGSSPWRGRRA
ncbi:putative membrane protein [Raineyella antarctica]|uniref:Putative membrane protein n=1 Tax=Raineyella antarctica TaxID=1577474 RepID=A0A1G6GE60_9ACTN|nr:phage holin family protein [Raineyella antarctica]SDB80035.1 putative membrane protein [Raineyella antarctica]